MRITTYGAKPEAALLAALLAHIPDDAKVVMIKCPVRQPPNAKPCQMPNGVIYEANIDNTKFIALIHRSPSHEPEFKFS